ncbi:CTU2 [Candida jiufengensis]|uniref:CTU2 n=1 Tax=Candida jiufengensis TaxID=497108 RepID=UPI002224C650|nr:CTU2 [Candida jiufengensis]KAI5951103.1 CTU2 [Candida jiufengensis]
MKAIEYLSTEEVCQKCKKNQTILKARNELYCKDCFLRLIRGKQRKQMSDEKYKINYKKTTSEKVLLAFSGGVSSLVLLDVLANLIVEQIEAHNGLRGFDLVIVNLNEYEYKSLSARIETILPELLKRYNVDIQVKILSLDSYVNKKNLYAISLDHEFTIFANSIQADTTMMNLLESCANKSSAEDLLSILLDQLLLKVAVEEKCNTVVYAHSMTRIANEIIALTVKGRGSTIHKSISDRKEIYEGKEINIIYPLRDVLFDEIVEYAKLSELQNYIVDSTISKSRVSKNLTIKDLVSNYFTNLNQTGYASTASTVMKIGQKLTSPQSNELKIICKICGSEIYHDPKTWLKTITVNDPAPIATEEEEEYVKMYFSNKDQKHKFDGENIDLCYGCITTLNGTNDFVWPIQPSINLKYDNSTSKIIDEFVLTDNEED